MILYETTAADAFELIGVIHEREEAERHFTAGLHGVEIKDGQVTRHGQTAQRAFHERIADRVRRRR